MWLLSSSVLLCVVCASALPNGERSFTIYEIPESIMSFGYPAERHHVTTEDGYILEMQRIPRGRGQNETSDRPVVFLMHGLLASANSFVAIGPNNGMGFNLADAGFDVWMGNARGTRTSRRHIRLDPDDDIEKIEFFDFTWEEIGLYDVSAMVDYALNVTGRDTLHYIGHSQGGTAFLVLASMKEEYNNKIRSAHLLAGVGYQDYFPNTNLANMARFTDMIFSLAVSRGMVELYQIDTDEAQNTTIVRNIKDACEARHPTICALLNFEELEKVMTRADEEPSPPGFLTGGAALKQFAHYGQNIRDKLFRRWHHGNAQNLEIYGGDPPQYNLSLITTNVTMHYTISDNLLDERDVHAMAADMPNTYVRRVARDSFLHEDFVAAEDNRELVTEYIIKAMQSLEQVQEMPELPGLPDSASSIGLSVITCFLMLALQIILLE